MIHLYQLILYKNDYKSNAEKKNIFNIYTENEKTRTQT